MRASFMRKIPDFSSSPEAGAPQSAYVTEEMPFPNGRPEKVLPFLGLSRDNSAALKSRNAIDKNGRMRQWQA